MNITELTGTQLQTAMLTLRLTGHEDAANVFQAELTRRAEAGPERMRSHHYGDGCPGHPVDPAMRKIKVKVAMRGRNARTLTYQTAQDVKLGQQVEVPRWPGMPEGPPLRGEVVDLESDREGPLVTIIGG